MKLTKIPKKKRMKNSNKRSKNIKRNWKLGQRSIMLATRTWKRRAKRKKMILMMRIKNLSKPRVLRKKRRKSQNKLKRKRKKLERKRKNTRTNQLRKREERAKLVLIKRKNEQSKNDHLTLWIFDDIYIHTVSWFSLKNQNHIMV